MSAMLLLLWTLVLAIDACNNRYVSSMIIPHPNETFSIVSDADGEFHKKNHTILVEEVGKNGKSEVKVLELPDYDEVGEELDEAKSRDNRNRKRPPEPEAKDDAEDGYGCGNREENRRRRKCLKRRKKFLTRRYKNWKELIRRAIKNLDEEIKNLRADCMREYKKENLNGTSGIPVRGIKRKKP